MEIFLALTLAPSLSLSLWLLVLARPGTRYGLVCLSQTDTQTEGAGRETFAYQAALNINITRLRRRRGQWVNIWAGAGEQQQLSQAQVLECEMKLCKAGVGDEDNGSRTRTKIWSQLRLRSLPLSLPHSHTLPVSLACAWKLFSIFVIWQMVTLPLCVAKPRAPTICPCPVGGRASTRTAALLCLSVCHSSFTPCSGPLSVCVSWGFVNNKFIRQTNGRVVVVYDIPVRSSSSSSSCHTLWEADPSSLSLYSFKLWHGTHGQHAANVGTDGRAWLWLTDWTVLSPWLL